MGSRRLTSERILCINCNICVNSSKTQQRYLVLEQNTRVVSSISNWISPVIVTEGDYICEACYNLAMKAVNSQLHGENINNQGGGPSHRGHMVVCLECGRSLLNKRSHLIRDQKMPTEIIQIMENRIAPREILSSDRLCHACLMKIKRCAVRTEELDQRRSMNLEDAPAIADWMQQESSVATQHQEQHSDAVQSADPDGNTLEVIQLESPEPQPSLPVPSAHRGDNTSEESTESESESPEPQPNPSLQPRLPDTVLRNYKRAPNTASHCMFYGCDHISSLHSVSDALRRTLLINHKYYAPVHARVCSEHLQRNSWDTLFDAENSMSTFTVEQIEHMLSFTNVTKPFLDFSSMMSVEHIDDHLFGYWMGMTKENFCLY